MASVRLSRIVKIFDDEKRAVNDISLLIEDNSFVVLIGPSGCGKTTILNIIAGLEQPSSGSVYINDQCVNDVEPKNRNIAMVFQNYALYPHLSVFDNLAFALKIRHIEKDVIIEKVVTVAKLLRITELLKKKPKNISGGERQRVAIGRAIIREPSVFLMDEPLSNLDAHLRISMREELKKLYKELHTTFIYVTHDQNEAMTLATHLVVMDKGVVQQVGTPYDVFIAPQNTFVATFIGTYSMNIFDCDICHGKIDILGIQYEMNLTSYSQSIVTIGIRPEDFDISDRNAGIPLTIESFEILGSNTLLYCSTLYKAEGRFICLIKSN